MCTVVQDIQGENIPIYLNNKVIETETYTTTHGLKVVLVDGMIYPIKREGSYTTSINPYKATMFFRGIISEPIMPELVLLKTEPPEEAQVLFKLGDIALVEWFIYSPQDTRITYSCTHIPTGKSISNSLLDWANRKRATPIVNWTVKNQITAIKALDKFLKGRQVTADLLREFRETAKK
jgi:hypothetical protein